ncbi:MarR family transcriptional regulator [Cognatiyoonia sp. IB215446]|uniref:MarR family winged helix-turn-helix transcriptional regulator n=1 Tax=Cognatiyoonia sp. IB215446 TaxID=3097355 RepID=UPI002A127782|nr:MarR family transcriptional regulator [Cognatiyoonia sp. IB215446]MDX8347285.1 MarR family transcriptional regulator [Cognatiyoonia sp. IB215446]
MSRADELRKIVRTLMRVMLISERTPPEHQHAERYNPHDFHTLGLLRAEPGLRATALANRLHVAPTTASSLIARLVKRGLVSRDRDPDDGRAVALSLTEQGRAVADTIHNQDLSNMELFLSAMSAEEGDQLIYLLGKVGARVEALERSQD